MSEEVDRDETITPAERVHDTQIAHADLKQPLNRFSINGSCVTEVKLLTSHKSLSTNRCRSDVWIFSKALRAVRFISTE